MSIECVGMMAHISRRRGRLSVVGTGQGGPCLDLRRVSAPLAAAAAAADLVVIEGMGRAVSLPVTPSALLRLPVSPLHNAPSGKLRGAVRTHSTSIPQMGVWFPPQWYLAPGLETAAVHVLSEFFTTFRGRWALFRCFCHRLSCPTTSCAPLCLRDGRSWAPAWAPPSVRVATLMRPFGSRQTLEGHHPPTLPFHPRRFHQLPCPLLSSAPLADTYYFQSDRRVPPTS